MSAVSGSLKRFLPMFDRILVQRAEAMTKTKGGIIIPEKSQGKVLEGTVVAAGPGARNEKGETVPMSVQVGDQVMLPEFGGTKVEIEAKEYTLLRESDIVAKFLKDFRANVLMFSINHWRFKIGLTYDLSMPWKSI